MSNPSKDRDAALIDPYGIYGTRTAHRLRNRRQRQQVQEFILVLIVLAIIAVVIYSWTNYRIPKVKASASWPLVISPSAMPAWDPQYQDLLIPTQDGQIVATWPLANPVHSKIYLQTDFPILSAPVMYEKYFYVGSEDGTLYAMDRQSGKLIWQHKTGTPISTQPRLLGGLIFCGNDGGWLFCLRTDTGKLVWKRQLPSPIGKGLAVVTNPTKLVIAPLSDGAAQRGGVWALNANNGLIQWKFPTAGVTNAQQITPPVTADIDGKTRVFCANDTGALINLNAANGKYGGSNDGWKVYFQNETDLTSRLLFRQPPLLEPQSSPTRLYINGNDDVVRCVDTSNGRILWKWQAPEEISENIQLVKGQLLVPCRGSVSYLLNSATGEVNLRLPSNSHPFVSMLNVDNDIWALDSDGTLLRYTLSNP